MFKISNDYVKIKLLSQPGVVVPNMSMKIGFWIVICLTSVSLSSYADEPLPLEHFMALVKEQSLNLKVNSAQIDAEQANAVGVNLPPPMVALSQMHDESGQANGFEISQSIPFPTKLSNDHSSRSYRFQARKKMSQVSEKQILAQGRLLYFNLWREQERLGLLREKKSVLQQHIKLSTAGARSDNFFRIHVLKAESDFDLLESEILASQQLIREIQIQMAEFINRNPNDFKPLADEPPMAVLPHANELLNSSQIEAKGFDLESLKAKESEARSSWFPDLNLRYRESGGTAMSPRYSEVMLGVTLPFIFFWEPKAMTDKASVERLQAEIEFNQEKRKVETRTATLLAKAESIRKQLDLLKEKLLPRAEKRMRLVHNLAPRDMETLQDHRETMEAFPELKMKALELRLQYEEAVAELQTYTSEESR